MQNGVETLAEDEVHNPVRKTKYIVTERPQDKDLPVTWVTTGDAVMTLRVAAVPVRANQLQLL